MKYRLLELLQSVQHAAPLRVEAVKTHRQAAVSTHSRSARCKHTCGFTNGSISEGGFPANDCAACYGDDIEEGELVADTGERYLISGGIPRLLSSSTSEFLRKNKKSFSLEWKYSRGSERNWGQSIEFRKELFLQALGSDPKSLRGKLILDAGCGSGLLARAVAESYGMEVVAVDLATGIEHAHAQNTNPQVHFIQGSVLELPLKSGMFDYVYCAGVLIHLPDTRQAFDLLPRLLKPGGRLFIWVYHPIDHHARADDRIRETIYQRIRSRITSRLPINLQELVYLALVIPFVLRQWTGRLFNHVKDDRNWREKMQNFIDTFSPTYVNRHTEEEVLDWYRENGFVNCTVTYRERYGFGVRGDLMTVNEAEAVQAAEAESAPVLAAT